MCESLNCVWLSVTPWTVAHQAPPSMGFSRREYWSGLPCPPPGDLPDPGIEPGSPALAGRLFTIWASREALLCSICTQLGWSQNCCKHPFSHLENAVNSTCLVSTPFLSWMWNYAMHSAWYIKSGYTWKLFIWRHRLYLLVKLQSIWTLAVTLCRWRKQGPTFLGILL